MPGQFCACAPSTRLEKLSILPRFPSRWSRVSISACQRGGGCNYGWPMSQQSESLLTQKQSLRLSDLPSCCESLGESTAANDLPEPDFVKEELEAESAARHLCNLRLKTLWTHFPDNRAEPDRPRKVRPDQLSKKYRQQILRVSAITSRNTVP